MSLPSTQCLKLSVTPTFGQWQQSSRAQGSGRHATWLLETGRSGRNDLELGLLGAQVWPPGPALLCGNADGVKPELRPVAAGSSPAAKSSRPAKSAGVGTQASRARGGFGTHSPFPLHVGQELTAERRGRSWTPTQRGPPGTTACTLAVCSGRRGGPRAQSALPRQPGLLSLSLKITGL